MQLELIQYLLVLLSGILVGFVLGLIGGGGSILAVPLLIYFVGYDYPHLVIGTTALAVGINAFLNLIPHAKEGHTNVKIGTVFSIPGIIGVLTGAQLGLITPGTELLFLFALLMIAIALTMLIRQRSKAEAGEREVKLTGKSEARIALTGGLVGFGSGYFGIGGGFMIVPGLIYAAGLGITEAIGTSLMSVGTFGLVTATRYGLSGDLNYIISLIFIAGGILGGWIGSRLTTKVRRNTLITIFSSVVIIVAAYMLYINFPAV